MLSPAVAFRIVLIKVSGGSVLLPRMASEASSLCPALWAPCLVGQGSIRACGMAALTPVEAREAPLWFGALPHCSETQCPCLQNGDTALCQCGQPRQSHRFGLLTGATPWPPWLHGSASLPRLGREQPWSLLFIDSRSSRSPESRLVRRPPALFRRVRPPQGMPDIALLSGKAPVLPWPPARERPPRYASWCHLLLGLSDPCGGFSGWVWEGPQAKPGD